MVTKKKFYRRFILCDCQSLFIETTKKYLDELKYSIKRNDLCKEVVLIHSKEVDLEDYIRVFEWYRVAFK